MTIKNQDNTNDSFYRLIGWYLGIIFILSWALQGLAIQTEGGINGEQAELWLVATMFIPALVSIIFLIRHKQLRSNILWKPNRRIFSSILIAVLVPTLIAFVVVAWVQQAGFGHSRWFVFSSAGVDISGGPWLLGKGNQTWLYFIGNIGVTGLFFSLLNAIPAAGEEFAWRGFFQSLLTKRFGTIRGIVLLGVIWSLWHLPAQLAGYNYPENPVLGSFILSPIELVSVSLFLGWLTIRTKSFIPAAVAHGAGNSIQEGVIGSLELSVPRVYEDILTLSVTMIAGLLFWYLLKTSHIQKQH